MTPRAEQVSKQQESRDPDTGVAADLRAALGRALELGGRPVHRLGSAGTSVTFAIDDEPDPVVTLLLDRHPPEIRPGNEPAEVAIAFSRDQARAFLRGELILPNEILSGAVGTRGPVRRYLVADPVLRGLLARVRA